MRGGLSGRGLRASPACHFGRGGCTIAPVAPSVSILGSFFPAWLISIVVGVLLTVAVHRVLVVTQTTHFLRPAGLGYTSLALALIFTTWLLAFGG